MGENSYNYKSNESLGTLDENAWAYWYQTANELKKENKELKAKLEIAIKALEFYADESNWLPHPDWHQDFELINDDSDTFMNDMNENNDDVIGGRRARQALKEIKE